MTTNQTHQPIYPERHGAENYVIQFTPEQAQQIQLNRHAVTFRLGNKYDYLNLGDIVTLSNSQTGRTVAQAKITAKRQSTFADLPLQLPGQIAYRNKEQQRTILSGFYPELNRPIQDDDGFLILEFELTVT